MHYLAGRPTVRHVCETGFNLGHSSFNYLTANGRAVVHSFDIGEHRYASEMADYIRRQFPGRFFAHFGDSRLTLPEFVRSHGAHRCDLIHVDGGHTHPVAMADLQNMAAMANVEAATGNVIVFDDYPSLYMFQRRFGWAWENMRRWGYVRETMRCIFGSAKYYRGFVVGTVVRRPNILPPPP